MRKKGHLLKVSNRKLVTKSKYLNIVRFYFDGLMMHIHLSKTLKQIKGFDSQILGFNPDKLIVTTVSYEISFQKENFENIVNSYKENPL